MKLESYHDTIATLTKNGWEVVSEGWAGATLRGPKKMRTLDKICLWFGVATVWLYGVGILFVLIAVADYLWLTPRPSRFVGRT